MRRMYNVVQGDINWHFNNLGRGHHQSQESQPMTSAHSPVVEMSIAAVSNNIIVNMQSPGSNHLKCFVCNDQENDFFLMIMTLYLKFTIYVFTKMLGMITLFTIIITRMNI